MEGGVGAKGEECLARLGVAISSCSCWSKVGLPTLLDSPVTAAYRACPRARSELLDTAAQRIGKHVAAIGENEVLMQGQVCLVSCRPADSVPQPHHASGKRPTSLPHL